MTSWPAMKWCRAAIVPLCLGMLTMAIAPDAQAASARVSSSEMLRILKQPVGDLELREQTAPPAIKAQLQEIRSLIGPNATFKVGYTTALDLPIEALAGTVIPQSMRGVAPAVNARAKELMALDLKSAQLGKFDLRAIYKVCSANMASFDWRKAGKVTPVKAQICGTCWDFTAMGAYEGSYAIRNNQKIDTSEQYILNCASAGDCGGGWWMPVFDHMIAKGNGTEAAYPFTGNDGAACPAAVATPYRATAWGFVGASVSAIPSVQAIKQALCAHGPLATAVMVDNPFRAYTTGVFKTNTNYDWINHGVTIIGWDNAKSAWLIKNSWGTGWGGTGDFGSERGYMWIDWGTNNVGIATAWVDAKVQKYVLVADWAKLLATKYKMRIDPIPGEKLQLKQLKVDPKVLQQLEPQIQ